MLVNQRESESKKISQAIKSFTTNERGSTIYISGVPGSGKTFTVQAVLNGGSYEYIYVNCADLKRPHLIYNKISKSLKCSVVKEKKHYLTLCNHLQGCSSTHIIVIDEVDMLLNKKQNVLYNIFDLPYLETSKILIFAIANTMNLPEKLEPKVSSRLGRNKINFAPYNAGQLQRILPKDEVFEKGAIDLVAKRVASITGDVRRALNVVEISKTRKTGKITVYDINDTMNEIYRPLFQSFLGCLTFYQKIVLFLLAGKNRIASFELFANCSSFCTLKNYEAPDFFGFLDILESLESYQVVEMTKLRTEVHCLLIADEIFRAYKTDTEFKEIRR